MSDRISDERLRKLRDHLISDSLGEMERPTMIERVRKTIMDATTLLFREGKGDKIGVVFINYADTEQLRRQIVASGRLLPTRIRQASFAI